MYVLIIMDRVGDVNIKNKTAAFRTDRIETIHVIQNTAVPYLSRYAYFSETCFLLFHHTELYNLFLIFFHDPSCIRKTSLCLQP